jgi:CBS domain-containing protein
VSARAAWRLETLGFTQVYRYQAGKDDWLVARLPLEGEQARTPTAADVARRDVPTCGLHEPVTEVAARVRAEGWPLAVVLGEGGIVLGRLRPRDLAAHPHARAEEVMVDGPRTTRGTRPAAEMAEWLDERRVPGVLVTTADGELVGYVRRDEL